VSPEDKLSAVVFRGDEGEVLRQASAVVGRPVVLWEMIGPQRAVPRASSGPDVGTQPPGFDLNAILRQWSISVSAGSRWVSAPGATPGAWVVAPVRSRPPAPPPSGRERRSKERLALELAGLALGLIGNASAAAGLAQDAPSSGMLAHQAANPLTAARAGLQLAMESIGRWVDLAPDRRLVLLDDLGEVLEDIDRTTELLRAVRLHGTTRGAGPGARPERFDAVRVVRSCLTLERRLLQDRGLDLEFSTALETTYLKGDPNALFDLLVNVVRHVAEGSDAQSPVAVLLELKTRNLELTVRGRGDPPHVPHMRGVVENTFGGSVTAETTPASGTTLTIALPLPPQRDSDREAR
jgi:signal transduction histidine kinase